MQEHDISSEKLKDTQDYSKIILGFYLFSSDN